MNSTLWLLVGCVLAAVASIIAAMPIEPPNPACLVPAPYHCDPKPR